MRVVSRPDDPFKTIFGNVPASGGTYRTDLCFLCAVLVGGTWDGCNGRYCCDHGDVRKWMLAILASGGGGCCARDRGIIKHMMTVIIRLLLFTMMLLLLIFSFSSSLLSFLLLPLMIMSFLMLRSLFLFVLSLS